MKGAGSGSDRTDHGGKLIKHVAGNLYKCLSMDMYCRHRFSFGFDQFCSWLLKANAVEIARNLPCRRKVEEGEDVEKKANRN